MPSSSRDATSAHLTHCSSSPPTQHRVYCSRPILLVQEKSLRFAMIHSPAKIVARQLRALRSADLVFPRTASLPRYYTVSSRPLGAAVNESPSATHPQFSGNSEGAGPKEARGIAVNERLSNTAERSLPSDGSKSFGFEISSQESRTGGKAKSQGRPIYLDMQVSYTELQRRQLYTNINLRLPRRLTPESLTKCCHFSQTSTEIHIREPMLMGGRPK